MAPEENAQHLSLAKQLELDAKAAFGDRWKSFLTVPNVTAPPPQPYVTTTVPKLPVDATAMADAWQTAGRDAQMAFGGKWKDYIPQHHLTGAAPAAPEDAEYRRRQLEAEENFGQDWRKYMPGLHPHPSLPAPNQKSQIQQDLDRVYGSTEPAIPGAGGLATYSSALAGVAAVHDPNKDGPGPGILQGSNIVCVAPGYELSGNVVVPAGAPVPVQANQSNAAGGLDTAVAGVTDTVAGMIFPDVAAYASHLAIVRESVDFPHLRPALEQRCQERGVPNYAWSEAYFKFAQPAGLADLSVYFPEGVEKARLDQLRGLPWSNTGVVPADPRWDEAISTRLNPHRMGKLGATPIAIERRASVGPLTPLFTKPNQARLPDFPIATPRLRAPLSFIPTQRLGRDGNAPQFESGLVSQCRNLVTMEGPLPEGGKGPTTVVCKRLTSLYCESLQHHPDHRVPVCETCASRSAEQAWNLSRELWTPAALRHFACRACTAALVDTPGNLSSLHASGYRVFETDPNRAYDPRSVTTERHPDGLPPALLEEADLPTGLYGGKSKLLPGSGCACVEKLSQRVLCDACRCEAFTHIIVDARKLHSFTVKLSQQRVEWNHDSSAICFLCHASNPVDHPMIRFKGTAGREGLPKAWACRCCHSIVLGAGAHNPLEMVPRSL